VTEFPVLSALALAAALAACSTEAPETNSAAELTAVLDSPLNATLTWRTADPAAAGRVVEFATEPNGEYTVLQYAPVERNTYRHPDLIPDTNFHYRLRTYSGPTSESEEITLPPGELDDETQAADHGWITPKTVPGTVADLSALRAGGGAPTDFRATVVHANGIGFTWTDHATDEDGYLLEVRAAAAPTFTPAAVLDANTNSTGLITLPDEKTAEYRVRAFRWTGTSNVAHIRTGPDPDAR
jgi:hypothetical protein